MKITTRSNRDMHRLLQHSVKHVNSAKLGSHCTVKSCFIRI
uniref:Uncharacterized protein n=1 Tax=Arundo donax TaxID=35708 RepID=A0A0A8Z8H1_ARUDO